MNESSWNVRSRGTKVPRERMFHGTKVLGTFAPKERKFHRSESSKERMFHGTKVPRERKFSLWTFRSLERKCRGTKRPGILYFAAPGRGNLSGCTYNVYPLRRTRITRSKITSHGIYVQTELIFTKLLHARSSIQCRDRVRITAINRWS